ncbi:MAG: hypothetical protein ACYTXF_22530 [Nostoc sp.]
MNNKRMLTFVSWVFISFLLIVGCSQTTTPNLSSTPSPAAQTANLTISAAASLRARASLRSLLASRRERLAITNYFDKAG